MTKRSAHLNTEFDDLELALVGVPREALARLAPSRFIEVAARIWDLRSSCQWYTPHSTRPRNYHEQLERRLRNAER
jgi:hypothetical protein